MGGLTVDALNPAILNVQYAVRGELAIKAEEYRVQLKTGNTHDLPFNKVISSNIGNPQQTGLDQPPITFNRQVRARVRGARSARFCAVIRNLTFLLGGSSCFVLQVAALMEWPALAELARDAFPDDVIARAQELQGEIGSIGAYSHSQGVPFIRKNVARFIEGQYIVILCCHPPTPPTLPRKDEG